MDIFKAITESGFAVVISAFMIYWLITKLDKKLDNLEAGQKTIAESLTKLLKDGEIKNDK